MSDKRVNIKITASTSDFDKAIKKAQKQIEKLVSAIEDIGKGKFGDKLEKQLESVGETTEKMQKQLEEMQESLDDINKSKTNKLEKQLDNAADSTEDLNDALEDTIDSLEDLNKAKFNKLDKQFDDLAEQTDDLSDLLEGYSDSLEDLNRIKIDKLEKQFKDVMDSSDKLNEEIEDVIGALRQLDHADTDNLENSLKNAIEISRDIEDKITDLIDKFKKLDSEDLNNLEDEFEQIQSAVEDLGDEIKSVSDDLQRQIEDIVDELNDFEDEIEDIDYSDFEDFGDSLQDIDRYIDEATDSMQDFNNEMDNLHFTEVESIDDLFSDVDTRVDDLTDSMQEFNQELYDLDASELDNYYNAMSDMYDITEDMNDEFRQMSNFTDDLGDMSLEFSGDKGSNSFMSNITEGFISGKVAGQAMENTFNDVASSMDNVANSFKDVAAQMGDVITGTKDGSKGFREIADDAIESAKRAKELREEIDRIKEEQKELLKTLTDENGDIHLSKEYLKNEKKLKALREELEKCRTPLLDYKDACDDLNKEMQIQESNYKYLRDEVIKFINTHKKAILNNKDVADSFMKLHDSMKEVYDDIEPLPEDMFDKLTKEAEELKNSFSLISTEKLLEDLRRLEKSLDDTTEKMSKFEQEMKEGFSTHEGAQSLINDIKDLKAYTDAIEVSVKKVGDSFVYFGDRVKDTNNELDTTRIDEYMDALNEFAMLIRNSGGQVSKAFANEQGQLDPVKYFEYFEKKGKPLQQINMLLERNRARILENLKAEKEHASTMVETAEAARREAKAQLEAAEAAEKAAKNKEKLLEKEVKHAKTTEEAAEASRKLKEATEETARASQEVIEARERLVKAEQELAEAQKKSKNIDNERIENAKKLVKEFNEQAEAARKLGSAIKDITQIDISSFDKSLGTLMDDIFPSDLPKTLGDFKEDLKAVFENFNSLKLGDMADGLKDVFSGVLEMIPSKVKIAIAAITALVVAMDKLYESGKRQFFEGLDKGFEFLSKLGDIARDVGQEVKDAFEEITGTNLDWSSLMALGVEFEHQMTKVGSLAGANTKQIEELTAKAKELGGATQFSASQVGEAFEYMATAGWSTEEMLEGVEGVINLSIGSCSDLATTANVVTDGMTALGMSASDTAEYVNKLAAVANASNTSVELFGGTLKQVGSLAGSLGVTMTDLSTATGLMANSGVKGTRAGTALKNVLANMASPTEKQAEALKELGFTADETGSYLKTTAEGNVDLEATIKSLMQATKDLDTTERAALLTIVAGKEALPGLMAIIAQGEEAWDDLSKTIDNSSSSIQFWNQNMSIVGKSGEEATKHIDNLKQVFEETIEVARALDMSQAELSHIIALLGHDSNVTADNVRDLLAVEEKMSQITDEQVESLRQLDQAQTQAVNSGYDYDKTVAAIKADTQGMTQEQKKALIERLKEVETYKEAQQVISDYQDEINKANNTSINLTNTLKRQTFAEMNLIDTLEYLRATMGETIDDTEKTILTNMGLGDSIDEISEILAMSQDEWEQYKTNLEETDGLTDELTDTMETTFRSALMEIASKIEDVVLALYDRLLPGLTDAAEAVKDFFATWRGGEEGDANYTWDNFETAIDDLSTKIKESKPKIQEAVESLFDNVDTFISGGTLDSILSIGSSIINGICDGILKAEEDGTLDKIINDLIQKISNWIIDNGPKVQKVGTAILEALKDGIENNEALIENAMNVICDIIIEWTDKSGSLESAAGKFGEQFISLAFDNMINKAKNWIKEKAGMLWDILSEPFSEFDFIDLFVWDFSSVPGPAGTAGKIGQQIGESIFGKDPAGDVMAWLKEKFSGFHPIQAIKNWFTGETYADSSEGGTLISGDGSSNKKTTSNKKSDAVDVSTLVNIDTKELALVEKALEKLQKVAQEAANTVRTEFVNMTNIVRNQMLNVSNIIRNQAVNWANIIKNQTKNARDAFTQQMISMASVARTQMVNVSNIIRNQSVNWANIVKNQAKNARDHFTQQMMSMVKVAKNQMYNVLTTIRSYMSQISSATNKTMNMKINVNRTVATSYTGGTSTASALYAANTASTYSLLANNASALSARASSAISSGTNNLGSFSSGLDNGQTIHMHVNLEGKEIARAAAKYMNGELKMINKREDRKRGVK